MHTLIPRPILPSQSSLRKSAVLAHTSAWISYATLALYLTAPAITQLGTKVIGDGGDSPQNLWDIAWIHGWLIGHHQLYFTHQLLAPEGANLAWMTLALPINAAAALFTPLLGLVASYNLAVMLCLALDGASMFYLARRIGLGWLGSWAAGMAFMTAPHFVGEALGHIHELQAFFMVTFLIVLWDLLESESPRWWKYVALGGIWAVTFYAIEDYALYEVAAAVLVALCHPALDGTRLRRLWAARMGWALSAVIGVAAASPLWTMLIWGPAAVTTSTAAQTTATPYVVDALELLTPDPWGPFWWLRPVWGLAPGLVMAAFPGYLAWGAIATAAVVRKTMDAATRGVLRVSAVGMVVFGVLELGPYLHIAGYATGIPLPYLLLSHVPVWDDTLPQRLAVLTSLFASLLVGAVVGHLSLAISAKGLGLRAEALLVASCLALMAIGSSYLPYPMTALPKVPYVQLLRAEGGDVLFVPAVVPSSVWGQGPTDYMYVDARLGLPTPEGYISRLPHDTTQRVGASALLGYLWGWQFPQNPQRPLEAVADHQLGPYLRAHDVRSIVVLNSEVPSRARCVSWLRQQVGSHYRMVRTKDATLFLVT